MTAPSNFHALRFGRAAARYEAHADVQARMADALVTLWGARPSPARILEFGCGTGLLTRRLRARFPEAALVATDASAAMLGAAASVPVADPSPRYALLDASGGTDEVALPPTVAQAAPFDLIASGAVVQWFPDLAAHLRLAARLSTSGASGTPGASGAHYLVSAFDADNFPELNALLREPPFGYTRFPGHSRAALDAAARAAGWEVTSFLAWEEAETLPDARTVLRRMQDLGSVRDPRAGGRMTRANLTRLLDAYTQRFSVAGGVRLTWKPWAALLTRTA